jgi:hypothetical protein
MRQLGCNLKKSRRRAVTTVLHSLNALYSKNAGVFVSVWHWGSSFELVAQA